VLPVMDECWRTSKISLELHVVSVRLVVEGGTRGRDSQTWTGLVTCRFAGRGSSSPVSQVLSVFTQRGRDACCLSAGERLFDSRPDHVPARAYCGWSPA
jgi:hypothetical protein